jgi:hypothetical protein
VHGASSLATVTISVSPQGDGNSTVCKPLGASTEAERRDSVHPTAAERSPDRGAARIAP